MTERERFVLRAALLYAQSNLSDLNEAFEAYDENEDVDSECISVNGDSGKVVTESEVEQLLFTL